MAEVPGETRGRRTPVQGGYLHAQVHHVESGARVRLTGELDAVTGPQLRDVMSHLNSSAAGHVELDLSRVTFLDLAGARALVEANTVIEDAGGRLSVHGLAPAHQRLAELLGLGRFVEIVQSPDLGLHRPDGG